MEPIPNIGLFDICLSSFYIIIIYFFCKKIQKKKLELYPEYEYFTYGLSAKLVGAIIFVLFSVYYYKSGDTFRYFRVAENLRNYPFLEYKELGNLFLTPFSKISTIDYYCLEFPNRYYERSTTWFFARFLFLINILSFGSYLTSSILISFVSFVGVWLGYISFARIYSKLRKVLFFPFFLIPTALFWSSGILRDTIIVGIVGVLIYSFYQVVILKHKVIFSLFFGGASLVSIMSLKPVLFYILFPSLFLWWLLYFIGRQTSLKRGVINLSGVVILLIILGGIMNTYIVDRNEKYEIQNLLNTLNGFQTIHPDFKRANSAFSLGSPDDDLWRVMRKTPNAINVTLFRPYLWEVKSFVVFIAAIESLLLLLFLLFVIIVLNKKIGRAIFRNKEVVFLLFFALLYGVVTGLSASDFGALTRFKIPAVLFFIISLIILSQESSLVQKYLDRSSSK